MLTRFHHVLIGLFAAQLVLAAIVLSRGDDTAVLEQKPILVKFDAAKVMRVQIATTSGKPVDLARRGDAWVLASGFDYPVVASKVTDLLASVAKLSAASPIATQASRHKQLRVADDEYERKLTLTVDGKDTTLLLGGGAGSRRNALRLAGDSRVFAVTGLAPWSIGTTARQWVETSYVRVPKDEIGKLVIERGGKTIALSRSKAGEPWTVTVDGKPLALAAGESLDTSALDNLVNAAADVDLDEPADAKRNAQPTATVTIERLATNASAAPIVLDLVEDGDRYWVHQRGLDRAILVEKARLDVLVTAERDKLVKRESPSTSQAKPAQGGAKSG
jgi:hypothetical protein